MKCLLAFVMLIGGLWTHAGEAASQQINTLAKLKGELDSQEELLLSIQKRNSFLLKGIERVEKRAEPLRKDIQEASKRDYPPKQKLADTRIKNALLRKRIAVLSALLKRYPAGRGGMTALELLKLTHTVPDLKLELEIIKRELREARVVGLTIDRYIHTHRNQLPVDTKPDDRR